MSNKFIIINESTINPIKIFESITNCKIISKILNKIDIKIPFYFKFDNNYSKDQIKIIYKTKEYITINNDIINSIESILKTLSNDINFDEMIIELNNSKNIELYYLPSYCSDYINNKLISLYEKYFKLENIIIINLINNLKSNDYIDLIDNKENDTILIYFDDNNENIDIIKYKKYFYIINDNYNNFIKYFQSLIEEKKCNMKTILNNLYLDLDNYEDLLKTKYDTFFNNIYISNTYRHHHFYKTNNNIKNISITNYDESKKIFDSNNFELLDEYKEHVDLINKSINIFDELFDYYIKKIEPEILKYYMIMYYNNYTNEFENEKEHEFNLMLKGLRKMCISLVKQKLNS